MDKKLKLVKLSRNLIPAFFYADVFLFSQMLGFDHIISILVTIFLPMVLQNSLLIWVDYNINLEIIKSWKINQVLWTNIVLITLFIILLLNVYDLIPNFRNRKDKELIIKGNYG